MPVWGLGMETWAGEGCVPLPFAGAGFCGMSLSGRFLHCVAERGRVSGLYAQTAGSSTIDFG